MLNSPYQSHEPYPVEKQSLSGEGAHEAEKDLLE